MDAPVFSFVIPTYNRPDRLAGLLDALLDLDYPIDRFEVVVVDDGSRRPPDEVVDRYRDRLRITYVKAPHGGVAAARQAGSEAAHGKYLAFTDDDCRPARDWLSKLEPALERQPRSAAGGMTRNALSGNVYSVASQALITYLYRHIHAGPGATRFFTANNMAMDAAAYREVGGLDVTWPFCGEDRDLCARWQARGFPLIFVPDAIIFHAHELTLRKFWKQHYGYGRGACRFRRTCARRGQTGETLQPWSFYFRLPLAAWMEVRGWQAVQVAALLVLSQVANTAGFLRERLAPSPGSQGRPT